MKLRFLLPLLVLGCACGLVARAQKPAASGIAHVAYRAGNADAELAFFAKLGYEPSFSFTNKAGKVTQIFVKVNDRQFIEVYTQLDPAQPLGWLHVCYESDDLTAYAAALASRGLTPGAVHKAGAGNLITAFNDPDGRTTEFTQYMPGSKHLLDQGQHLGANRISTAVAGVEFAAPDQGAARKFYEQMGFTVTPQGPGLHIQITEKSYPWISLLPAGSKPALYLHVENLKQAEAKAQKAGLTIKKQKKSFSTTDPEGNTFIFTE